jgi:hypothetical protein
MLRRTALLSDAIPPAASLAAWPGMKHRAPHEGAWAERAEAGTRRGSDERRSRPGTVGPYR